MADRTNIIGKSSIEYVKKMDFYGLKYSRKPSKKENSYDTEANYEPVNKLRPKSYDYSTKLS